MADEQTCPSCGFNVSLLREHDDKIAAIVETRLKTEMEQRIAVVADAEKKEMVQKIYDAWSRGSRASKRQIELVLEGIEAAGFELTKIETIERCAVCKRDVFACICKEKKS